MEKKEEKKVCCICGKEYEGYGYNPFPVKEEGCCCQSCNYSVVVPERWEHFSSGVAFKSLLVIIHNHFGKLLLV